MLSCDQILKKTIIRKKESVVSQEIVIMVGYPGSGKSTYAEELFGKKNNYVIIHGDDLKTSKKMITAASEHVKFGKSVVFDSTNPSKKRRKEYIDFAKINGVQVRCIHVTTSLEESWKRNNMRPKENIVPRIVYNIYKKNFELPEENEGCKLISL